MAARVDPQHSEAMAQMRQHAVPQIHVGAEVIEQTGAPLAILEAA